VVVVVVEEKEGEDIHGGSVVQGLAHYVLRSKGSCTSPNITGLRLKLTCMSKGRESRLKSAGRGEAPRLELLEYLMGCNYCCCCGHCKTHIKWRNLH
jgi:hypothetical protein